MNTGKRDRFYPLVMGWLVFTTLVMPPLVFTRRWSSQTIDGLMQAFPVPGWAEICDLSSLSPSLSPQ
jgi:hypothetical protein